MATHSNTVRKSDDAVTPANYFDTVDFGKITLSALRALEGSMKGFFLPTLLQQSTWPDSLKKEFTSQVHKFMANLNDTIYQREGKTILYIPQESLDGDVHVLSSDKDLTQRLETTMIHWTRQIKEVVNNQDIFDGSVEGPLDEIQFWRNRTIDLSGISDQLEKHGVQRIVQVLGVAKSSYLAPFMTLSALITRGTAEAKNNLKFLDTLTDPCLALSNATPQEVPELIPPILNRIRMIWNISEYYNTHERVTSLLRKISNEIIARCCASIHLEQIFNEDVFEAMTSLERSISCSAAGASFTRRQLLPLSARQEMYPNTDI